VGPPCASLLLADSPAAFASRLFQPVYKPISATAASTTIGVPAANVGTLITKTLVVAGDGLVTTTPEHPRGAMLRAYDKLSGKEVGAVWMPAPQTGSPMTYMWNGKQYIIVAVSGGVYSGEYIAYTLPD